MVVVVSFSIAPHGLSRTALIPHNRSSYASTARDAERAAQTEVVVEDQRHQGRLGARAAESVLGDYGAEDRDLRTMVPVQRERGPRERLFVWLAQWIEGKEMVRFEVGEIRFCFAVIGA